MASKVSVGKTSPVPLGQQPAANSLPVVFAEDQPPIPVEEQNKIQSEVALSLLGIPRAEVALGIFADVNTYDVSPTEWAQFPVENVADADGNVVDGVEHVPDEAGAKLVATDGNTTILTSKRFFRYQPGRVSSSTMGVKMNKTLDPNTDTTMPVEDKNRMKGAPSLKKWGIFDKFDGYYFEIANAGVGNDFRCVRRTQAIIETEPKGLTGNTSWVTNSNTEGLLPTSNFGVQGVDPVIIRDGLVYVAAAIYDPSLCYSPEDVRAIDGVGSVGAGGREGKNTSFRNGSYVSPSYEGAGERLKDYTFDSNYAVRLATLKSDGVTWDEKLNNRKFQFPFDQDTVILKDSATFGEEDSLERGYIRSDAHCNFFKTVSNFNRKGGYTGFLTTATDYGSSPEKDENFLVEGVTSAADYRNLFTWDPNPSTDENVGIQDKTKVWHLLVNVQGKEAGTASVQTTDLDKNDVYSRDVTNGNVTLKEWFNTCVPRPFRLVYEWRPVRAMFSGDKLDGAESVLRWSDINTAANDSVVGGGDAINRPGDPIIGPTGEALTIQSAYNVDFSKVTMWKTEFSWYGAVGAIFLCYVPISNGEARWVRVHQIRASNQHSVASLGNATLPITYLTHGGIQSGLDGQDGSNLGGNILVKYGASYYIDGGDKGTVRLLSKASDFSREVPPGFIKFPGGAALSAGGWEKQSATTAAKIQINNYAGNANRPGKLDWKSAVGLMGAYVEGNTANKVKWVSPGSTDNEVILSFSDELPEDTEELKLIIPRAQQSLLSFRAKDFILNRKGDEVRNRLQIYPIKLGAGITGGGNGDLVTLRTIKNPLKIVTNKELTSDVASETVYGDGTPGLVQDPDDSAKNFVNTKTSTLPAKVAFASNNNPTNILSENDVYRYGYFIGTRDTTAANNFDAANLTDYGNGVYFPVIGRLFRKNGEYFFAKLFSYPEPVFITGYFLPERHLSLGSYDGSGYDVFEQQTVTAKNHKNFADQSKWDKLENDNIVTWEEITRLSGVRVGQDLKLTPIAETGNEILAYYGNPGGYQFDLQDYFAYNKEYLSFPLTDQVDILNLYGHYDINSVDMAQVNSFGLNSALSWEEQ